MTLVCFHGLAPLLSLVKHDIVELNLIFQVFLRPVQLPYSLLLAEHVADFRHHRLEVARFIQGIDLVAPLRTQPCSSLRHLSKGRVHRDEV